VDKSGRELPHPASTRFYCYFYDPRYEMRATEKIIKITIPSLEDMKAAPSPPPRQIIPMQKGDFLSLRPKQHISVPWFIKWGPQCLTQTPKCHNHRFKKGVRYGISRRGRVYEELLKQNEAR
jgi:hypothetical protein